MTNLNEGTKIENTTETASPVECLVILQNSVKTLREMKNVQCNDGNWNYDPYMHGMANGIIFALSLFDDKRPEYLEAPEEWLVDKPDLSKPITEPAAI